MVEISIAAFAPKRAALIIGSDDYFHLADLPNPVMNVKATAKPVY